MVKKIIDSNLDTKIKAKSNKKIIINQSKDKDNCGCKKDKKCKRCRDIKVIDSVPYFITESGKYCVSNDLLYTGLDPTSSAISISANNVEVDFNGHILSISSTEVTGISILDSDNVLIKNGTLVLVNIVPPISVGEGFLITNSDDVILDNFYISSFRRNITVVNSTQISILGGRNENAANFNVAAFNVVGLRIEKGFYTNPIDFGGLLLQPASNVTIYDTDFFNADIFYVAGSNSSFDKIRVNIVDVDYIYGAIQLGAGSEDPLLSLGVRDLIIKDSTFVNKSNQSVGPASMFIVNGKNIIVSDSVLSMDPSIGSVGENSQTAMLTIGTSDDPRLAGLIGSNSIGEGILYTSNITIKNNTLSGSATYGVVVASPDNAIKLNGQIKISNNNVSIATEYLGFLLNTNSVVFKENDISNSDNIGILVDGKSSQNVIKSNTITGVINSGISLTATTSNNVITDNIVISGGNIINSGSNIINNNTVIFG